MQVSVLGVAGSLAYLSTSLIRCKVPYMECMFQTSRMCPGRF
jgi:hypothetical protein